MRYMAQLEAVAYASSLRLCEAILLGRQDAYATFFVGRMPTLLRARGRDALPGSEWTL